MKAKDSLTKEEYKSIKESFFNIYILFSRENDITRQLLDCILKWGIQLDITEEELDEVIKKRDNYQFGIQNKEKALEQIYDLVYMIYLDDVVEDVELEVAMLYAEKLGFEAHLVGDLLKAIVAAPSDGVEHQELKNEIKELLTKND